MALFRETVPREQYDDMRRARDLWQQECALLRAELSAAYKELVAFKRHEVGLPPHGFEPKDPTAVLGPQVRAAIAAQAGDYADLATYLTNWALAAVNDRLARKQEPEQVDAVVAEMIRQGETE